ncbi:uncharacterized protein LOC114253858 isoform X2 [Monomorium pharaonis]|nr:uncharacterized protein LOC114253858 isoform X2 [Monomorium pharaonis]
MTSQSSMSSPSSKKRKLLEDIGDNVFGASEKSLLLKYLENISEYLCCTCVKCLQEEALHLGYQLARDLSKIYSTKWDENRTLYPSTEYFKTNFMRDQLLMSSFVCKECRLNIEYRTIDHVLTTNDKQSLLVYIENNEKLYCRCVNCVKEKMSFLAYQLARELHRNYNITWDTHMKADTAWIDNFAVQFRIGLYLKSPKECKAFIETSTSEREPEILTFAQEKDVLKEVQIQGTRKNCKCQTCSMKEVEFKVYQTAKSSGKSYPLLWDKKKKADRTWMQDFKERHAIQISEIFLSNFNCKYKIPRTPTCLTLQDERWLLLQIDSSSKTRFDCKCRSCVMKEVTYLTYEFVREYSKPYPGIKWDIYQRADSEWLERFKIRQNCVISNCDFAEQCQGKEILVQSVTISKPFVSVDIPVTVFTLEEEK